MLRVFVDPIPRLGIAMRRTALALRVTAPEGVQVVDDPGQADVQVLHAVDRRVLGRKIAPVHAVMMHCLDYEADPQGTGANLPITAADGVEPWAHVWGEAALVWSYYDLTQRRAFTWGSISTRMMSPKHWATPHFYFAPLGVDGQTFVKPTSGTRDNGVLTTGYVSGPQAEAIEEMALAAAAEGLSVTHLGPYEVAGMTQRVPGWEAVSNLPEAQLVALYQRTQWVSGLRQGEGFELPVVEGLACGVRPVCFDLPCYRTWFGKHAAFVPPSHGEELVGHLRKVLHGPPRPVLPAERAEVLAEFNWQTVGDGFWRALLGAVAFAHPALMSARASVAVSAPAAPREPAAASEPTRVAERVELGETVRDLVWIGDSPTTDWTGFGRASKHILDRLRRHFRVHCIGTTHNGDPYSREEIPYDVYPLSSGVGNIITKVRPSVVVIQHDPWQVAPWLRQAGNVPVIATMPIDGKNCRCDALNGLALAIWWTRFAFDEARRGGYSGPACVIPLGVDTDIYKPMDRREARKAIGLPPHVLDSFIVGYVARNQPRKRMDLAVRHFAEWVKTQGRDDAYLYLQTAPTGEGAYDVSSLMRYERLSNRLILAEQGLNQTFTERKMAAIYNALDVFWSTTQGEGWGLPAMEAMACGKPCVLPDWSAYGDWAREAAVLVPIAEVAGTVNFAQRTKVGVLGGVPSRAHNVQALDQLYTDPAWRASRSEAGLALVRQPCFRWDVIGDQFVSAVNAVLSGPIRTVDEALVDVAV